MALKLPSLGGLVDMVAPWWKAALGAVLMFGPAFLLGQCSGKDIEQDRQEAARAVAVVEALQNDGAAKEVAAGERLADAVAVAEMKEELTDAVQDLPDGLPSARRVALACARMRADGRDVSDLPACSGPGGGAQAPAPAR
jgi:hypothetical protein